MRSVDASGEGTGDFAWAVESESRHNRRDVGSLSRVSLNILNAESGKSIEQRREFRREQRRERFLRCL